MNAPRKSIVEKVAPVWSVANLLCSRPPCESNRKTFQLISRGQTTTESHLSERVARVCKYQVQSGKVRSSCGALARRERCASDHTWVNVRVSVAADDWILQYYDISGPLGSDIFWWDASGCRRLPACLIWVLCPPSSTWDAPPALHPFSSLWKPLQRWRSSTFPCWASLPDAKWAKVPKYGNKR